MKNIIDKIKDIVIGTLIVITSLKYAEVSREMGTYNFLHWLSKIEQFEKNNRYEELYKEFQRADTDLSRSLNFDEFYNFKNKK